MNVTDATSASLQQLLAHTFENNVKEQTELRRERAALVEEVTKIRALTEQKQKEIEELIDQKNELQRKLSYKSDENQLLLLQIDALQKQILLIQASFDELNQRIETDKKERQELYRELEAQEKRLNEIQMKISEHRVIAFAILFFGFVFGILIRRPVEGAFWGIITSISHRSDDLLDLLKSLREQKKRIDGVRKRLELRECF